jgi:membrane dipeptidase
VVVTTLLARHKPWVPVASLTKRAQSDWPTAEMAYAAARGQLAYYQRLEAMGHVVMLRTAPDLTRHWRDHAAGRTDRLGLILTLEGTDPVVTPEQLPYWRKLGLCTAMLAHFGQSRHAHGTPSTDPSNTHDIDGPLTDEGRALLAQMHRLGMPLDLSHLSDRSFAQALDAFPGPVYASHNTCRALVPDNDQVHPQRMLTDAQARAIFDRGGVVGLPLFNAFLKRGYTEADAATAGQLPGGGPGGPGVTLDDVADHLDHLTQLAGRPDAVALGTDMDGGFGNDHTPAEVRRYRDIRRLADVLAGRGWTDDAIASVLGKAWLALYLRVLPA